MESDKESSSCCDIEQDLLKQGVSKQITVAIRSIVEASIHINNAKAQLYANAIRPAFEQSGINGVKKQVLNLLHVVSFWSDEDGKNCRTTLNHWTKT